VVLFIGRIIRDKGISELVEAMRSAVASEPKLVCIMVGAMPGFDDSDQLKTRLATDPILANHIRLLPACGPNDVPHHLCGADIFAFPSHKEGMPNSLLEALGMGVPAVAFAIPPIREIESGTGCLSLVRPFDSNEFSRAILNLAASPENRRAMGEKGRSQTMARFLMSRNMEYALEHLQQVVSH
jgi:glycosyltransferase involved in cell wall biosynthesis